VLFTSSAAARPVGLDVVRPGRNLDLARELTELPPRDVVEDKPVLSGVPAVLADPREAGFVLPDP
jgi:hypothetical protein